MNDTTGERQPDDVSDRQLAILRYIREFHAAHGYSPSIRDIQAACHISSTSVVVYNLDKLELKGYIHRDPQVNRSIVLVQ